ncbi:MAG: MFS transporter [Devosia sp.]|uniref:MFS transporter n=1 Tax=Devosia sp. TaxID=1871048 RepID=UPI001AC9DAA1|nr:MFS transporter [Devosia sp.]MBN9316661.1 MFS transporter [Devosia sp.]
MEEVAIYIAIFALFLGTLSIGTTEFVIAGILPAIAADLSVPIPTAGLLVTAYAIGVAVGGPILTLLLAPLTRKRAALILMALFIAGHFITGLAGDFGWALAGRLLSATGHGGYFGVAVVLVATIAPRDRVGTALSFIFAGVTIANIIGVPAGTMLGQMLGWRAPLWMVAAMATVGALAVLVFVPDSSTGQSARASIATQFRALGNHRVLTSFALIFLMMIALWGLNTFIAPYLTDVVGVPAAWISGVLLLTGIGATVGIFIGGRLADLRPTETLRYAYPLLAAVYVAVYVLSPGNLWLGIALAGLIALPITLVATTVQNRVLKGAGEAPDLASTLISSVFNVGTATGSWISATALGAGFAYAQLPLISVAAALCASVLAYFVTARDRREALAVA